MTFPKMTRRYIYSMYMAPRTTPVAVSAATQVLTWKMPSRIRNSPMKPPVPGRPTEASMNTMNVHA